MKENTAFLKESACQTPIASRHGPDRGPGAPLKRENRRHCFLLFALHLNREIE
jgi:hypothetical protein